MKNIVASHSNIALDEINTVIEYEEMTNSFAFGSMENLPCVSGNECEEGKSDYNDQQRAFTSDCL